MQKRTRNTGRTDYLTAQARELGERIEEFCRQTVVTDLHSLPGG